MKSKILVAALLPCLFASTASYAIRGDGGGTGGGTLHSISMSVTAESHGVIAGLACDTYSPTSPVSISIKDVRGVEIASGQSVPGTSCQDNLFSIAVPRATRSRMGPGTHPVKLYGSANAATGTLSYNLTVRGTKTPLNSSRLFASDCRYMRGDAWEFVVPQGNCSGNATQSDSFKLSGTNEDNGFLPVNWFLPDDEALIGTPYASRARPYFFYSYNPQSNGTYQTGWVIDKINFGDPTSEVGGYSGGFFNDSSISSNATLDKNIFVDVKIGVYASEQATDANGNLSKNRTTVGFWVYWNNGGQQTDNYMEVNIQRSANFDLCTATQNLGGTSVPAAAGCDVNGVYDRRNFYNVAETMYYNINSMSKVAGFPQSSPAIGAGLKTFTIPVSELVRQYAWVRPPDTSSGWAAAKIGGEYIGHEVWGRGRQWAEAQALQLYSFDAD